MMESPLLTEFGFLVKHRLDIQDLVDRSRNLIVIAHPLVHLIKYVKMLLCWEHKWTSFSLLLMLNIVGLLISEICLLILLVTFSTTMVSISICHYRYCLLKKVIPTLEADADYNLKSHPENMRDFRILLALLENIVIQATNFITKFYSFLKCEDLHATLKLHMLLFVSLLILIMFPMRYFILFLLDLAALIHPLGQFFKDDVTSPQPSPTKEVSESETAYSNIPEKPEENTSELITETSDFIGDGSLATDSDCSEKLADDTDEEAPQDVLLNSFLVQSSQPINKQVTTSNIEQQPEKRNSPIFSSSTITNNSINNHGTLTSNRNVLNQYSQRVPTTIVEKLMELKKKAKSLEKCSGCQAIFTAILKRRHICSCCGNHYCFKCCSHKVPRSKFGATAPAAQTETVAVCTQCLHKLVDLDKEKIV